MRLSAWTDVVRTEEIAKILTTYYRLDSIKQSCDISGPTSTKVGLGPY